MNFNGLFFRFLAAAGMILEAAILIRMYKVNLHRELRMFFAYTAFSLCRSVTLTAIRNYLGFRSPEYFITYWLTMVADITLAFFVIQEVYAKVLYRYEGLRKLSSIIFRWAFMVLALVAGITALASPAADRDFLYSGILLLDRSAMMIELGLIVLLFVFAKSLALGWRECVFGIAVGMCFYCSLEVAALSLRTHYANAVAELYSTVKPIFVVITLGIWTAYIYRAERASNNIFIPRNHNLDEWNNAVLQFLNR